MKKFFITLFHAIALMALMITCIIYGTAQTTMLGHALCIGSFTVLFFMFRNLSHKL